MIRPLAPSHNVDNFSLTLGKVPTEEVIKDSLGQKIEKLCGHSEYQPRVLYVTESKLLITYPDQDDISDQIPLVSLP